MFCLLRPCHLTLFIVLAALSPACSPLLDAYFVSPVCIERCVLVFPFCLSLLNLIGNFLFLFLPSPTPPFSCRPFLVCSSCVCPCTRACEFFSQTEKKVRGRLVWNLRVPVVAALLPLPPFLCLSHSVSPSRQLWIWHLNKYESALFFFCLPPPPFCLRIHTLSSRATTEGRVSLISLVQRGTSQPAETR